MKNKWTNRTYDVIMDFDIEKLEFKAKLAGDGLLDFGFIRDHKAFFEWCKEHKVLSELRLVRERCRGQDNFYVCEILMPMKFRSKHIKHIENPGWVTECKTPGTGNMLVSLDYIPYAWPSIVEEDENGC